MPAVYPSYSNVFVPSHEATNKLVVDFARNVRDFAVNNYAQIIPVKAVSGYYLHMTVEEAGRVVNSDLANFMWPDGQPAPEHVEGTESFEFLPFAAKRYSFGFTLGDLTVQNASWDIVAQHASIKARQAMTARTQLTISALDGATLPTGHEIDVSTIVSTKNWANSTPTDKVVQKSLIKGAEAILNDTLGAVQSQDLVLVINSDLAGAIATSPELVDYIKGSPEALAQIRGELSGRNVMYGLPDRLFGFNVVVEGTRKVTSKKGASRAVAQILANNRAYLVSRPGGLVGVAGTPNFSSVGLFMFQELVVETLRDENNKRLLGRVVETYDVKVVAPAATVRFINCQ